MSKIIDYVALSHTKINELNNKVADYIQHGWEPLGGVSVSFAYMPLNANVIVQDWDKTSVTVFAQAMVKYGS